ncbi:hypothetical protein [Rhodococcus sp. LB1]|uniref:hypothetical protein n=1 Tax=Rhodococcus sp. LB1 TaxID=1807499 RepID=UPI0012E77929|nr:hypothetical protein [Rhodococcus sp. LB1]
MAEGEFVQYRRPPVRNTVLRVYVEPIENFDLNLAITLNSKWGTEYPVLRQGLLKSRPRQLPTVTPPFAKGEWWAMSSIEQTNDSLQRVLGIQFDQISLSWTFDEDKPEGQYPGFEKLSQELDEKLDTFAAAIEEMGSSFEVHACECVYTNTLEDVRGPDWVSGYLTDWNDTAQVAEMPPETKYLGANFRFENSSESADTISYVRLKDNRKSQEAELTIQVIAKPLGDDPEDRSGLDSSRRLMQAAHRELITNFERCASTSMKENWGKEKR